MYSISKLSSSSQSFLSYISVGGMARSLHASIAIAKALSIYTVLPSSKVDSIERHYTTMESIKIRTLLSALNELVPVDIDAILSYVPKFYMLRYTAMYPTRNIYCTKPDTAVEDMFGITYALDVTTLETIRHYCVDISKIYNGAVVFFDEYTNNGSA